MRRDFIKSLLQRSVCPKQIMPFVTIEIVGEPRSCDSTKNVQPMLTELTGVKLDEKLGVGAVLSNRLQLKIVKKLRHEFALLAQLAAVRETEIEVSAWRFANARTSRWLRFLESVGYTLSEIETTARDLSKSV